MSGSASPRLMALPKARLSEAGPRPSADEHHGTAVKSRPQIVDFHDVMQDLADAGWSEWNNDIDRNMVETTVGPIDDLPRTYHGFGCEDEHGYFRRRSLAVCTEGHAEEF